MLRVSSTNGQTVALQRFLEAGCNPNGKLGSGLSAYQNLVHRADVPTPLMDAVKNGNIQACDILCRYGAALDICVDEGIALTVAAEYNRTGCCAVRYSTVLVRMYVSRYIHMYVCRRYKMK